VAFGTESPNVRRLPNTHANFRTRSGVVDKMWRYAVPYEQRAPSRGLARTSPNGARARRPARRGRSATQPPPILRGCGPAVRSQARTWRAFR